MSDFWADTVERLWGMRAKLRRLAGEQDLIFLGDGARPFVLKAMHVGCDAGLVEMQIGAMGRVRAHAPDLPVPQGIATLAGDLLTRVRDEAGQVRLVWMQEAAAGRPFAEAPVHSAQLMRALGGMVAQIDLALNGYAHPALTRVLKWNLVQGDWIAAHVDVIADPARRALIEGCIAGFGAIKSALLALPQQALHNDVNDWNILLEGDGDAARISGLIDFGDMCAAPRICDLAIACAYAVLGARDPMAVLGAIHKGYDAVSPLSRDETAMLWPLLRMRLAVSVVNSAMMAAANPDDAYATISEAPVWAFLEGPWGRMDAEQVATAVVARGSEGMSA